jgi:hypothetical protein
MILECTDCKNCLSFGNGFRVACGHPKLGADEVFAYYPLYTRDASLCEEFEQDDPIAFREEEINAAVEMFGDDILSLRKYAHKKGRISHE